MTIRFKGLIDKALPVAGAGLASTITGPVIANVFNRDAPGTPVNVTDDVTVQAPGGNAYFYDLAKITSLNLRTTPLRLAVSFVPVVGEEATVLVDVVSGVEDYGNVLHVQEVATAGDAPGRGLPNDPLLIVDVPAAVARTGIRKILLDDNGVGFGANFTVTSAMDLKSLRITTNTGFVESGLTGDGSDLDVFPNTLIEGMFISGGIWNAHFKGCAINPSAHKISRFIECGFNCADVISLNGFGGGYGQISLCYTGNRDCVAFGPPVAFDFTSHAGGGGYVWARYRGDMKLQNLAVVTELLIDLDGASVEIDSSVTAGNITLTGVGTYTHTQTGTEVVVASTLKEPANSIANYSNVLHVINAAAAVSGDALGRGLPNDPLNIADLGDAVARTGIRDVLLVHSGVGFGYAGVLTSAIDLKGLHLRSNGHRLEHQLTGDGSTLDSGLSTLFENLFILGGIWKAHFQRCFISVSTYNQGRFQDCEFICGGPGFPISFSGASINCVIQRGRGCIDPIIGFGGPVTFDFAAATSGGVSIDEWEHELHIVNVTTPLLFTINLGQDGVPGQLTLDPSVVNGTFFVKGVGTIVDNSGGTATVDTTGLKDPVEVEAYVTVDTVRDANGFAISGTRKVYATAADQAADTDPIRTETIVSTPSLGFPTGWGTYKSTKQ